MWRQTLLAALVLIASAGAAAAEDPGWEGRWDTVWRDGAALVTLNVDGDQVTGTFRPGNGRIEGRIDGRLLRGRWEVPETSGGLLFALAPDGQSFTGRYDNGEYWNGRRISHAESSERGALIDTSPRDVLRSLVAAGNAAAYARSAADFGLADRLLIYDGPPGDNRQRRHRRQLIWQIIDLSTFRIYDAPTDRPVEEIAFRIGPAGVAATTELTFRQIDNRWRLVVPTEPALIADRDRLLDALGFDTFVELTAARSDSPRAAMRDFILGAATWEEGGRERALGVLDLSFLPPPLFDVEAPVLADYLKNVIDRGGFIIWQMIPDDPDRPVPYVHLRHPEGEVVIDRVEDPSTGELRWRFTAETVRGAPRLFAAVEAMPLAAGVTQHRAISPFFELREAVRGVAPELLVRTGLLELWQWISLGSAAVASLLIGWGAGRFVHQVLPAPSDGGDRLGVRLDWPVRVSVAGTLLVQTFGWLGLAQTAFEGATVAITLVVTLAIGLLLYRLIGGVGRWLTDRAEERPGYADVILITLLQGVLKVAVVLVSAGLLAEVVGLPYEGIVAGLGVGGVAIAFAARDTVSNFLGGAILMSDRPFQRGDLVEADGVFASIESVGLRSTRLRTLDDALLIIPNSQLTDKSIVNWGRRRRRKVQLTIGLPFETPRDRLDAFVQGLTEVYAAQPFADRTTVYIGLKGFGPSSIDVELWGYFTVFSYEAQIEAQHALVGAIVDLAADIGVAFAYPTRTLHLGESTRHAAFAAGTFSEGGRSSASTSEGPTASKKA
ncbi:MAG: mechanosensitive ion channel family protein [Paracoccaceae bacterium]